MTRPALYLDECVNVHVAPLLASRGFTVTTARAVGMLTASDREQLTYASACDAMLVTFDRRDYRRLHLRMQQHAGMLLVTNRALDVLTLRIAIAVDWIAARGAHRNHLFRWNDVQQGLIAGERVEGYTEEEHRRAIGQVG